MRSGLVRAGRGAADRYIHPGHSFKVIDGLITTSISRARPYSFFVSAFCGRELLLDAYRHAVTARYRFYSYGDAMLIT